MDIAENILQTYENQISSCYGAQPRLGQVQMSLDIAEFLYNSDKRIMFVEAPVGTGKTLGSLIPVLSFTKQKCLHITYATATKSLQNQIYTKDVKLLRQIKILTDESIILAMGKDNYVCLDNLLSNKDKFKPKARFNEIRNAFQHVEFGFRAEIDKQIGSSLSNKEWDLIKIQKEQRNCDRTDCPGHNYRKQFHRNPYLTITNHSQLIQSQINIDKGSREIVSVMPGVIIIDEAHLFDENFLGVVQKSLNIGKLRKILRDNKKLNIKKDIDVMQAELNKVERRKYGLSSRHEISPNMKKALANVQKELQKHEEISISGKGDLKEKSPYSDVLDIIHNILDESNYTSWFTVDSGEQFFYIPKQFFENFLDMIQKLSKNNKIIFLSGTLTVSTEPEKEITEKWGLNNFIYKQYNSPFSPGDQVYLYLPHNGFVNRRKRYPYSKEIVRKAVKPLCQEVKGGMLILSNSLELKDALGENMGSNFMKRKVLIQGAKTNMQLTDSFKNDSSSILIGSGSFKSGFSVEGKALQTVVITALPFPVGNDPFIKLKIQRFASNNNTKDKRKILLQLMQTDLEQSMGRLVRTIKDYGVIYICDSRLYKMDYGPKDRKWLELKGYRISNSLNGIPKFLKKAPRRIKRNIAENEGKYSRSLLRIPSIRSTPQISGALRRKINKNKKIVIKQAPRSIEDYKTKIRGWQKGFNRDNPINRIQFRGLEKANSTAELIKICGDAAWRIGYDPDALLRNVFGEKYVKGAYKPDYNLENRTSGQVKVTKIKESLS